jgi:hypothetical protein
MGKWEHNMNALGKRFFHLLFVISAFLSCEVCAKYFSKVERDFRCPICLLFKAPSSEDFTLIKLNTFAADSKIDLINQVDRSEQFESNYEELLLWLNGSGWVGSQQWVAHAESWIHHGITRLYLLFKMLKIGDFVGV